MSPEVSSPRGPRPIQGSAAPSAKVNFPRKRVKMKVRFLKVSSGFIALWGAACDLLYPISRLLLCLVPRRGF
jgi:hypothetical protein